MINAKEYWKQAIEDYLESLDDDIKLDDNQLEIIANHLLNDEEMWQVIEYTMDYYIYHNKREGN